MLGLDIILIGTAIALLTGGATWLLRKRFHPGGTILAASIGQVVIVYLVKFYFSRA